MHNRRLLIILAVFCSMLISMVANAQLPQISTGLSYLTSSQNPDGTWQTNESEVETTAATVSVLETLKLLNQTAGSAYSAGTTWLQGQAPQSVTYMSERIHALNLTDGSVNGLMPLLDTLKGGWGGFENYEVTTRDTSLTLQALKAANYADQTVINSALAYLTNSQNDGGWGFSAGDDSNVYLTAIVSATLQQFPQMTSIATAVSKATTYLLAHQNPDGGFGTVYETALAYSALVSVSANNAALGSAVNYLTTNQSANGSWNDDPYSTALALKALYLSENKPSPPPPPPSGGKFTGTVVDSITLQRVGGATVALASNNLVYTVTDAMGNFTLPDVPPGTQTLNLSLAGFAPATAAAIAIADVTMSLGTLPMTSAANTGTISGKILDPTGKPLADVAIAVSGSWSGSAVTGADGTFSFSYVTPGEVTIIATKSGYQSFTGSGRVYARTTLAISPRLNATPSPLTTGSIIGRVVSDLWGFPIAPLPGEEGVRVTISGGAFVEPDPDNGGKFTLDGLAPNTYQVTVGMSGFISQSFRLIIAPGVTTDLGTIRLVMSASTITLTGKVTDSVSGLPLPAAEVIIVASNQTGRADFAGTYVIADIKQLEFTVKVSASGYVGKTVSIYQTGEHGAIWTQQMDVSLSPLETKGDLTGTVVDAASGLPLAGVILTTVADPAVSVTTDSNGVFTFAALPKGLQQVDISLPGYSMRTLTTAVMPGMVNNAGSIPISPDIQPAAIRGVVTDGMTGLPLNGAAITVEGTGESRTVTTSEGMYSLDNVSPGMVTVTAATKTPAGYSPASVTAPLEPGGLLVFNPALFNNLSATAGVAVQTDKTVYSKGETIQVVATLQNLQAMELAANLRLEIADSAGVMVYATSVAANLAADGSLVRNLSYTLPLSAVGGSYSITASLYDTTGTWIGGASNSFGVAVSRISVTPTLPAVFSAGSNTVSFNLANSGDLAVTSGIFTVSLKDPDGQVVANDVKNFSLATGESRTISYALAIPTLKFGNYTLAFTQSDETRTGLATEIALSSSITILPLFDKTTHRVRETASLTVTMNNKGRFNFGSGMAVTVSVPDAAHAETKPLLSAPDVGNASGSTLIYRFVIPESVTAGQHAVNITMTLPSGNSVTQSTKLTVPQPSLSIGYNGPETVTAGDTLTLTVENSGGIDAGYIASSISIMDTKGVAIYQGSPTGVILGGEKKNLATIVIPFQTASSSAFLNSQVKDSVTGNIATYYKSLTIAGVNVNLQASTDQLSYPLTGRVTAMASIANNGTALEGGSLKFTVRNGGSAIPMNGLRLWLKADAGVSKDASGYVSWWADQSGNNFNIVQGTYAKQPLFQDNAVNGKPAIRFDGNDDYLQTVSSVNLLNNTGNFSLFVVVKPGNTQKTWADIVDYQHNSYGSLLLQQDSAVTNKFFVGGPYCPGDGNCPYSQTFTSSQYQLFSAVFQQNSFGYTFLNGGNTKTQGAFPSSFSDPRYFAVGNKALELYPRQFNGNIAEVIIFNKGLLDSDRIAVERHLFSKYGIDAVPPSTNDTLYETVIPITQSANSTNSYSADMGLLNVTGKLYLNTELKNSLGQVIGATESPFYIVQGSFLMTFNTDKKLYKTGETVTVSGEVRNLSTAAAANLSLVLKTKDAAKIVQTLHSANMTILAGGSQPFTVTTSAGSEGVVTLTGILSQSGSSLAEIADQFEVTAPKVSATITAPDTAGKEPFTVELTLVNSGKIDAVITVAKSFSSPTEQVTIPAGQTKILQYSQQILSSTIYTFTLSGDLVQQLTKSVIYTAPIQLAKISAKTFTDKVSYNANEQVAISTTINCLDVGTTGDSLTATVMISNNGGEVLFTDKIILPAPDTGRVYTNSRYWNSAAYPPGVYTARLAVEDGGVALATAEATFTILPSSATAAGVAGTLLTAENPVYAGIDQSLVITLANNGNENLPGATYTVFVVNADTGSIIQTSSKTVALPLQGSVADSLLLPTGSLEERDYLAVLQIILPGMAEAKTLAGAPFGVKIAPPPTLLLSTLSNGAVTNNQTLNISGSVTGAVAMKSLTINSSGVALNSDGSFSHALLLQTGDTVVTTIATDILDHTAIDSRTITLDQQAPLLTIDSPADNGKTALAPIEVTGRVDETSTVTITVNGITQTVIMNGTDFSATVLPEPGWNTIEITATDLAGNPGSQKRSVLFDDQKPSLAITEPAQDIRTNKSSVTISGTAIDPYTAVGITVAMDGNIMTPPVVNNIFAQVVAFGDEKLYPIIVTATNEVGTQSTAQRNVIFDKTPPNLTIDPVVTPTNTASQTVTGTREEGTEVAVTCATATAGAVDYPTTTTWRLSLAGLQLGENRLLAAAYDLAGNRTTAAATILYVPKAPEVTISADPKQLWPPNKKLIPITITGNVVTFGTDLKEITISVADEYGTYNQQGLKFGDTVLLEAWREGNDMDGRMYTITAVVTDQAGNRTTRSTMVVVPHDMGG